MQRQARIGSDRQRGLVLDRSVPFITIHTRMRITVFYNCVLQINDSLTQIHVLHSVRCIIYISTLYISHRKNHAWLNYTSGTHVMIRREVSACYLVHHGTSKRMKKRTLVSRQGKGLNRTEEYSSLCMQFSLL